MGMSSLDTIPHLTAELADAGVDPLFRQCGILKVAMSSEEASELRHDLIWQESRCFGKSMQLLNIKMMPPRAMLHNATRG